MKIEDVDGLVDEHKLHRYEIRMLTMRIETLEGGLAELTKRLDAHAAEAKDGFTILDERTQALLADRKRDSSG